MVSGESERAERAHVRFFPWVVPAAVPTRRIPNLLSSGMKRWSCFGCHPVREMLRNSQPERDESCYKMRPTTSWSVHRSAGNLDGVGSASTKTAGRLANRLPPALTTVWSSRGRGGPQCGLDIGRPAVPIVLRRRFAGLSLGTRSGLIAQGVNRRLPKVPCRS